MSSLWDAVFIQVLDRTGPLMLNLSGTLYIKLGQGWLYRRPDCSELRCSDSDISAGIQDNFHGLGQHAKPGRPKDITSPIAHYVETLQCLDAT
jgi:hypothetical protein